MRLPLSYLQPRSDHFQQADKWTRIPLWHDPQLESYALVLLRRMISCIWSREIKRHKNVLLNNTWTLVAQNIEKLNMLSVITLRHDISLVFRTSLSVYMQKEHAKKEKIFISWFVVIWQGKKLSLILIANFGISFFFIFFFMLLKK